MIGDPFTFWVIIIPWAGVLLLVGYLIGIAHGRGK